MGEHRIEMTAAPADVERMLSTFEGLTEAQRAHFLRNVVTVVLTYKAQGDPAVLRQFADDLLATAEVHGMPSYRSAFAPTPA